MMLRARIRLHLVQLTSISPTNVSTSGGVIVVQGSNFGPHETLGKTWAAIVATGLANVTTGEVDSLSRG